MLQMAAWAMRGIDAPKSAPRLGPATMSALRLGQRTAPTNALRLGHPESTERPTIAKLGLQDVDEIDRYGCDECPEVGAYGIGRDDDQHEVCPEVGACDD